MKWLIIIPLGLVLAAAIGTYMLILVLGRAIQKTEDRG